MESLYLVGLAALAVFAFVMVIVVSKYFMTWLRARIANAPVSIGKMIGMSLRKVPVGLIVDNRITAVKAGLDVRSDPLEAHYLAGGDVTLVADHRLAFEPRHRNALHVGEDLRHHQSAGRGRSNCRRRYRHRTSPKTAIPASVTSEIARPTTND